MQELFLCCLFHINRKNNWFCSFRSIPCASRLPLVLKVPQLGWDLSLGDARLSLIKRQHNYRLHLLHWLLVYVFFRQLFHQDGVWVRPSYCDNNFFNISWSWLLLKVFLLDIQVAFGLAEPLCWSKSWIWTYAWLAVMNPCQLSVVFRWFVRGLVVSWWKWNSQCCVLFFIRLVDQLRLNTSPNVCVCDHDVHFRRKSSRYLFFDQMTVLLIYKFLHILFFGLWDNLKSRKRKSINFILYSLLKNLFNLFFGFLLFHRISRNSDLNLILIPAKRRILLVHQLLWFTVYRNLFYVLKSIFYSVLHLRFAKFLNSKV